MIYTKYAFKQGEVVTSETQGHVFGGAISNVVAQYTRLYGK